MSDIAAIRERWSNATIGPWEWDTNAYEWQRYRLWRPIGCHEVIVVTYDGQGNESMNVSNADAVAIAAAPTDIATLLAEVDRLRDVAAGPYLIMDEREGIIGIVNATDYNEAWATFQAKNPGDYDGEPDDNEVMIEAVTLEWCDKVVDALSDAREEIRRLKAGGCARDQRTTQFCAEAVARDAEIRRLTAALAAAQPVVEWRQKGLDVEEAHRNAFLLSVSITGWRLLIWTKHHNFIPVDSGPETGQEGKAACIAAYYRACGLPCP